MRRFSFLAVSFFIIVSVVFPAAGSAAETSVSRIRMLSAIADSLRKTTTGATIGNFADGKCGLRLQAYLQTSMNRFSPAQQRSLHALMAAPNFTNVRAIGHFEIFYDTTEADIPPALLDVNGER